MLDGRLLVDAHLHPPRLSTLKPAWTRWAERYGAPGWRSAFDEDGVVVPAAFDELLEAEGVDRAILLCEYSPKVTGIQPVEDLLPIVKHNPDRFAFLANVNPHVHYPIAAELLRQVELGAVGLKIHPVHGGFSAADPMMYPAYQTCAERGLPVVVHCGTSTFPGSANTMAAPELLDPVLRDFPELTVVLAHGGRGWWYDQAAFLALMHENVWIELSGLPPARLPDYYQRFDLRRLARKFVFATDWPGVPGIARNARALADLGLDDDTLAMALAGNALRIYFKSTTYS
ncbi:amidohydrolase family protein [Nonomuraea sp. CA-141351]|uniref:amidohydrolase family protein n=1 Tax=Nonomuraea sp. CA-141351 TaxID=3239996 RepID=UPI003D8DBD2E